MRPSPPRLWTGRAGRRAGRGVGCLALGIAAVGVPVAAYAATPLAVAAYAAATPLAVPGYGAAPLAVPGYASGGAERVAWGGASATVRSSAAGSPGTCTDADGVTVVVDFTDLGGPVVERCAGWPVGSGFDALAKAGFSVTQPTRTPGFVCRLQGRPSATETLDTTSDPTYHEQCVSTPPTDAYWTYWSAPNGGRWTYNTVGASVRQAVRGGFEGWSFALNRAGGAVPPPRAAPRHAVPPVPPPPTSAPPTSTTPTSPPPTSAPPQSPHRGARPALVRGTSAASAPSPSRMARTHHPHHRARLHRPRTAKATTTAPDPTTEAATPRTKTGALPAQPEPRDSSPIATVAGLCVVGLLAALGGVTAWRRRAGDR